ncbi:dicarboxylate/amino acid:cation symporter [Rheinheimera sp. MMS21-TC3]|uniref:dicarboxylate/amino acid:cation symporter n=1 Tax=Rheinheimera sp. MMS21-TC3 TaxID=3072790 RepID=UPI0028C3EA30|nr:dicarboxylate/amino acid:cation symporter [Rheinheimera sp. MMS21-TC3]WNO59650.1 dicarboxylate/amino acid:cation symporter [Rheinheimera sp. MMS21-TC3]
MSLIIKLIAGIVLGILAGLYAPVWLTQLLLTFKGLFGELLFFTIPLLILFFISSGIAALPRNSGKLLGRTLTIAYLSTIIAGTLAYFVAKLIVPMFATAKQDLTSATTTVLEPFIKMDIPPVFGVMTALALAFIFGLGIAATQAEHLKKISDQGRDIIQLLLEKVIIPLLPVYIAGVFAQMAASGSVFGTLKTFGIVLLLAVIMHWVWIITLYTLAGIKAGKSPFTLIKNMLPAYFTALGTMSSAATIPVSLQATKKNGVKPDVANFTVPLCATIHLSGSTITIVTCAMAVISMQNGLDMPSFATILPFILMLGVVMLAAPGVPGGAVMSAVGLLASMLGFGDAAVALMIALYMAQDSFGTACNVTGDGAIAVMVDK